MEKTNLMIKFSRHSKRRMKLYNLEERDIINVINKGDKKLINKNKFSFLASIESFNYPIKVICKIVGSEILVITSYPLKKGWEDEN